MQETNSELLEQECTQRWIVFFYTKEPLPVVHHVPINSSFCSKTYIRDVRRNKGTGRVLGGLVRCTQEMMQRSVEELVYVAMAKP